MRFTAKFPVLASMVPAVLAGALAACGEEALEVETSAHGLGTYAEVTGFGGNPGGLKMFKYTPDGGAPANAAVVFALHACSQTASSYRNAGWEAVADELGFFVVYPQQETGNNPLRCFNWAGEYGDPTNLMRGQGENQSIIDMVEKMKTDHGIDPARVFITGHSGGGAQTALMLATWPEVFAAGAPIAGITYNCTTTFTEVSTCLNPGIDRTAMQWGDRARAGRSGYSGPYPRVSIWQGSADSTVNPINARELLEQWSNVHGIDTTADSMDMVDGYPRSNYEDGSGNVQIEVYDITGMNHGTPVVPGDGCGSTAAYFLDEGICASRRIAEFFGLDSTVMPGDRNPPVVNITAPADGANVSGTVTIRATATDDTGVTAVEIHVGAQLKATLTAAPWEYSWNTSGEANGAYALKAVARDAAGNSATDDDTTVQVTGGVVDMTDPVVNITAPANGATVSGMVTISANATDDFSVARVEFLVDGASVGEATAAPFSVNWNTAGVAVGNHSLSAIAYDAAGNSATDDDTMVMVEMGATDTVGPTLVFTEPAAGAEVKGLITVKIDATDNVGVTTVLLFAGTDNIGTDYAAPYEFLWDTGTVEPGEYKLTARGFDAAGNIGVVEEMIVVVPPDEGGEPVKIGRKYWGCTAAPGASEQLFPLLLVLGGLLVMRRRALAAMVLALFAVGCSGEDVYANVGDLSQGQFGSGAKIGTYLEGKTMVMQGDAIPTHPNGLDEDVNYGQATQCYQRVTMSMLSSRFHVVSVLGTITNAPSTGQKGECDHGSMGAELVFDSTAVLIDNVRDQGACFDLTITFPGFGQEGRGSISEDGSTLVLELFFKDRATGHRCADGNVGDPTVTLSQAAFAGNALQTYTVGEGT